MAQRCYIFDASALVILLIKDPDQETAAAKKKLLKLVAVPRGKNAPQFYVPNFCMAECSSSLAKIFLQDGHTQKREDAYRQHIEALLNWVSSKKRHVIQTYKLKRSHLVDIENIFVSDRRLPRRRGNPLSGFDGTIIAMGRLLERSYGKGNVIILTTDHRIVDVCESDQEYFPRAIDISEQEIPGI